MKPHTPDILDCLANLSSDEVFTPPAFANSMLDHLPDRVWKDPSLKWLDPCSKTGVFLREVARRLMIGLASAIPDYHERREHIYRNMLYGIAVSELTSLISRRTLYECKDASLSKYSIVTFDGHEGNIRFPEVNLEGKNMKGSNRRLAEAKAKITEGREAHLHPFLYMDLHEIFGEDMQFNVIMGNPPYQMQDSGYGKSAIPIYNRFVDKAKEYEPDLLTFVIPARWYSGGKGLDSFRETMLSDSRISVLVDYPHSEKVFPHVIIAGGVCFFLRDQLHHGDSLVIPDGDHSKATRRKLNDHAVFVRDSLDLEILNKVQNKVLEFGWSSMSSIVRPRNFFGIQAHKLPSSISDESEVLEDILLVTKKSDKYIHRSEINKNSDTIDYWKVIASRTNSGIGGRPDKQGQRVVITKPRVIPPESACTETYLVIDLFSSHEPAGRLLDYVKTRFFRFLLSLCTPTQDTTRKCFEFVPSLPLDRNWNDKILYDFFDLTDQEIAHIESKIKVIN
ncbi:MAG: Eco57I restriction-modification methylase domain-containing protein [Bacteroidetes bacterium]|nr:Eco57I restriction-modification methylase domain-containing protein [Bacteroidota bacterium]